MKGYWLVLGTAITDQAAQAEYHRLWAPIAEKYGARLNPAKVPPLLKEARDTSRVIVVEFPSYDMAKDCYEDPVYQEAKRFALQASNRDRRGTRLGLILRVAVLLAPSRSWGSLAPTPIRDSRDVGHRASKQARRA